MVLAGTRRFRSCAGFPRTGRQRHGRRVTFRARKGSRSRTGGEKRAQTGQTARLAPLDRVYVWESIRLTARKYGGISLLLTPQKSQQEKLAEGEGFEPSIPFWGIHTFQACAFDHSATPPQRPRLYPARRRRASP
ncbi:protein of unknown function [Azospirillum baldaniorum]|uniref:Uncharacterized protein n=2 Tax=Azospirillum baldaniorum TaxID=1064539 RepID=A0A9P1NN41_9PROT|nr:protein of unknown function [Azospirillum baldaniorum]